MSSCTINVPASISSIVVGGLGTCEIAAGFAANSRIAMLSVISFGAQHLDGTQHRRQA